MARPLRIEFPGALYHLTSRGDGREDIYRGDGDRRMFLSLLADVCERFNWWGHAYCLMANHYHLLMETPDANLAKGMRQLNGVYTQHCNGVHGRCGHVFQGRYKAILVQKETYLTELARYIVLNPVRAGMVSRAEDWPWSSYRATTGGGGMSGVVAPGLVAFGLRRHRAGCRRELSALRRQRHRPSRALGATQAPGLSRLGVVRGQSPAPAAEGPGSLGNPARSAARPPSRWPNMPHCTRTAMRQSRSPMPAAAIR